jgi:glycosyltransferase involved in cell wall biosynthesis
MKISVVIPSKNRANSLPGCLDSVLSQTHPPEEIIVVDDASTDNTKQVVEFYAEKGVKYAQLNNGAGAQAARNAGIRLAVNDWIAFQDSDDEWGAGKLESQVKALAEVGFEPLTVVHTDCFRFDRETSVTRPWMLPHIDGKNVLSELLITSGPMFQGMMTSKAALEKIGLLDVKVPSYQEWDTAIRLAKVCRFIHLREPLFVYHLHAEDTISKNKKRDIDGYQYVIDKHRNEILELCGTDALNQHLENNALRAMRWGLNAEAHRILEKLTGSSLRSKCLKFMVRQGISPRLYGLASRLARRMRLL